MNAFKQQCIELRKKDFTLNEIMRATRRSKTSIYFHIKDIPLSDKKLKEISENSRQLALRIAASRKGIALRPYKSFTKWSPDMVLLVSHLMFDGEIIRKKCIYNNRSSSLIKRVEQLMKQVYDYPSRKHIHAISGVTRIGYYNVELKSFLHTKAEELLTTIHHMPKSYKREFIRAFFDDEGCMDLRLDRNLRRIRGYQNDKDILELIKSLLVNFGIESKLQGKNEIVIRGKENLQMFQKEINFSRGVRINGKRSNSIWKESLEKRELLKRAIVSFKI